jgi:hypothetical protein
MFCESAVIQDVDARRRLRASTLTSGDATFVHQHVVDACAAQHADETTTPMAIAFALVGLHLLVEGGMTGGEGRRVHIHLGRQKHQWPLSAVPQDCGAMAAAEVMRAP